AYRRAKTLAVIPAAVAVCALDLDVRGLISEADEHAETITDPRRHVDVLLSLVAADAARCPHTRAAPYRRARTLAAVTEAVAATGDPGHARDLADRTQTLAAAIG